MKLLERRGRRAREGAPGSGSGLHRTHGTHIGRPVPAVQEGAGRRRGAEETGPVRGLHGGEGGGSAKGSVWPGGRVPAAGDQTQTPVS